MPGSPVGVAYTWNPTVLAALNGLVDFYQVPLFIQTAVTKLLEDKGKLDLFLTLIILVHQGNIKYYIFV